MPPRKSPRTPTVHIVLDTNCLFTDAADKLIALELSKFIASGTKELGLDVNWYIPKVVRLERHSQMVDRATTWLPTISKLEKLLGHNINITKDIINLRVSEAIDRSVSSHNLQELSFDPNKIDWHQVVDSAVKRLPPFSKTEKEKGFKDAIVLETFYQFSAMQHRSPSYCRIVFLTSDELLLEATKERTKEYQNTIIIPNIDELKSFLTAISSHIPQESINKIIDKARSLFFDFEKTEGLYFKWDLSNLITSSLNKVEKSRIPENFKQLTNRNLISAPVFSGKNGQKLTFTQKISRTVEIESKHDRPLSAWNAIHNNNGIFNLGFPSQPDLQLGSLANLGRPQPIASQDKPLSEYFRDIEEKKEIINEQQRRTGIHIFEITWEVTLSRRGQLLSPKLVSVEHKSTTWDEA